MVSLFPYPFSLILHSAFCTLHSCPLFRFLPSIQSNDVCFVFYIIYQHFSSFLCYCVSFCTVFVLFALIFPHRNNIISAEGEIYDKVLR